MTTKNQDSNYSTKQIILITTINRYHIQIESRKYDSSPKVKNLCSLENLSIKIGSLYALCPERLKLDDRDVKKIQDQVLSGCYRLSPFRLTLSPLGEGQRDRALYQKLIVNFPNGPDQLLVVIPEESDNCINSSWRMRYFI